VPAILESYITQWHPPKKLEIPIGHIRVAVEEELPKDSTVRDGSDRWDSPAVDEEKPLQLLQFG
jgi:hypothetical protein